MLTIQHLNSVFGCQPGEWPRVKGLIWYENFACGLRVKQAFDELFLELLSQGGWGAYYRLSMWSFRVLRAQTITNAAAREAAHANVLCVAVKDAQRLGPEIEALVRQSLIHHDGRPRALVLAGFGEEELPLEFSPVGMALQEVAEQTGMNFVVHPLGRLPFRELRRTNRRAEWELPPFSGETVLPGLAGAPARAAVVSIL